MLLAVLTVLAVPTRAAAAQQPSALRWTLLSSDSTITAWMDTTHIRKDTGAFVGGWYKTKPGSEPVSTVVHYLVDCPGFRLSVRRIITYDGAGTVIDDHRTPTRFVYPPPILALQNFMHYVCRRFPPK